MRQPNGSKIQSLEEYLAFLEDLSAFSSPPMPKVIFNTVFRLPDIHWKR
jgi:hypothetical protein